MQNHKLRREEQYNGKQKFRYTLRYNKVNYQINCSQEEWNYFDSFCRKNNFNAGEGLQELFKKNNKKIEDFPLSSSHHFRKLIELELKKRE